MREEATDGSNKANPAWLRDKTQTDNETIPVFIPAGVLTLKSNKHSLRVGGAPDGYL